MGAEEYSPPRFLLRYCEMAASVTPNVLATPAWDMPWPETSSHASSLRTRGSICQTTTSQGIFIDYTNRVFPIRRLRPLTHGPRFSFE